VPGADSTDAVPPGHRPSWYSRALFRAPSVPVSIGALAVISASLAALAWVPGTDPTRVLEGYFAVFLIPGLVAAFATPAVAGALGGRFRLHRSSLLAVTAALLAVPLMLLWRGFELAVPNGPSASAMSVILLVQGPMLWLRHMSLFGVSRPSHAGSIVPSLLQPVGAIVGLFVLFPPTPGLLLEALAYLLVAFLCCALLLRAADRPLRREFGVSGVSLIRPLLEHISMRDPGSTASLERFFARFAKPATVSIALLSFRRGGVARATIALPTVHPGPFAALGASDLPRKLSERLGPAAGTVLVPHTPCNHDLDLPSTSEVDRIGEVGRALAARLDGPQADRSSPLVAPRSGSLARAQLLGETVLVVVGQAPAPTDDIDFAVADQIARASAPAAGPRVVLIDAHNSYVEDEGDITYGTPTAERLIDDARAAIAAAVAAARPGPVEVGVAVRAGYTIGRDGIGPTGIRALVVRGGGTTTAYVLLDGNNLVRGLRAPVLSALEGVVDAAEVMTTDNHVVHEVDGGVNPIGERLPADRLVAEVRGTVEAAVADLTGVSVFSGSASIPDVPVLGPDWTARLLTSLGDTFSMFANAFLMTFLLLLASSLVVLAVFA